MPLNQILQGIFDTPDTRAVPLLPRQGVANIRDIGLDFLQPLQDQLIGFDDGGAAFGTWVSTIYGIQELRFEKLILFRGCG